MIKKENLCVKGETACTKTAKRLPRFFKLLLISALAVAAVCSAAFCFNINIPAASNTMQELGRQEKILETGIQQYTYALNILQSTLANNAGLFLTPALVLLAFCVAVNGIKGKALNRFGKVLRAGVGINKQNKDLETRGNTFASVRVGKTNAVDSFLYRDKGIKYKRVTADSIYKKRYKEWIGPGVLKEGFYDPGTWCTSSPFFKSMVKKPTTQ